MIARMDKFCRGQIVQVPPFVQGMYSDMHTCTYTVFARWTSNQRYFNTFTRYGLFMSQKAGCVGVWMYGRVDVWMCGCAASSHTDAPNSGHEQTLCSMCSRV